MRNVTIVVDEALLNKCRAYAAQRGMSFNSLVRAALSSLVSATDANWTDEFFKLADQVKPDSKGQKWTRDDLHRG